MSPKPRSPRAPDVGQKEAREAAAKKTDNPEPTPETPQTKNPPGSEKSSGPVKDAKKQPPGAEKENKGKPADEPVVNYKQGDTAPLAVFSDADLIALAGAADPPIALSDPTNRDAIIADLKARGIEHAIIP